MLDTAVIAIFFAAPAMGLISTWIFDGNELCKYIYDMQNTECLEIDGKLLKGAYFSAAACVLTNIYVSWTMYECGVEEFELLHSEDSEDDKMRGDTCVAASSNSIGMSLEEGLVSVNRFERPTDSTNEKDEAKPKPSLSDWLAVNVDVKAPSLFEGGGLKKSGGDTSPADFMDFKALAESPRGRE